MRADDLNARITDAITRAARYLLGRQCSNGGFCFYKSDGVEEPSLWDTHHALAALRLAATPVAHPDLVAAFAHDVPLYGVAYLYHQAAIFDLLGRSSEIDRRDAERILRAPLRRPPPRPHGVAFSDWLVEALQTVKLRARLGIAVANAAIDLLPDIFNDADYWQQADIEDFVIAVELMKTVGRDARTELMRTAFGRFQVARLGFVFVSGSAATTLEALGAGVRGCGLLGLAVQYPQDVLRYVLGCQTDDGAFGRAPLSLPDIEQTHTALAIFHALKPAPR